MTSYRIALIENNASSNEVWTTYREGIASRGEAEGLARRALWNYLWAQTVVVLTDAGEEVFRLAREG